jgi:hypothetical protein
MLLNEEGRKKLMAFLVTGTGPEKKKSEDSSDDEESSGEESGCTYACEKMIEAFKAGDADKLNQALSEWFEMKPGDNSEVVGSDD